MKLNGIYAGIPAVDLAASQHWYERLTGLKGDAESAPDMVVFEVSGDNGFELDRVQAVPAGTGWGLRLVVEDVERERASLIENGFTPSPIESVSSLVAFCHLHDPDGNLVTLVQELS
ncbi:VOC family protein [Nonomuraea sp. NPDC050394]|uniref:VOC family protein n=1 Tax=Nonomuraea sp. NPDC050394 TaxID=3364363 RepID=UPI0037AD9773